MYHELYVRDTVSFFSLVKKNSPEEVKVDEVTGVVTINSITADSLEPVVLTDVKRKLIYTKTFLTDDHGKSYKKVTYVEPFTLTWNILYTEVKKIGKYECKKATTFFRGRNYTAWYTEQVPLSIGPWKFHGLPGLIVQISDTENYVFFILEKFEIPYETSKKTPLGLNYKNPITVKEFFKLRNESDEKSTEVFLKNLTSKLPRGATIEKTGDDNLEIEINFE